jgi:hypothetical protein
VYSYRTRDIGDDSRRWHYAGRRVEWRPRNRDGDPSHWMVHAEMERDRQEQTPANHPGGQSDFKGM